MVTSLNNFFFFDFVPFFETNYNLSLKKGKIQFLLRCFPYFALALLFLHLVIINVSTFPLCCRSRLSYEQFSSFLTNVKELNAHKQTKEVFSSLPLHTRTHAHTNTSRLNIYELSFDILGDSSEGWRDLWPREQGPVYYIWRFDYS